MTLKNFDVEVLNLKKDDILVIKTENNLSRPNVDRMKKILKDNFEIKNKIMFMESGVELKIIRQDEDVDEDTVMHADNEINKYDIEAVRKRVERK